MFLYTKTVLKAAVTYAFSKYTSSLLWLAEKNIRIISLNECHNELKTDPKAHVFFPKSISVLFLFRASCVKIKMIYLNKKLYILSGSLLPFGEQKMSSAHLVQIGSMSLFVLLIWGLVKGPVQWGKNFVPRILQLQQIAYFTDHIQRLKTIIMLHYIHGYTCKS